MATNTDDTSRTANGLNYDNLGFLIGQRRLERSMKSVAENTHEILEILKAQLKAREQNPADHQISAFQRAIIDANRQVVKDTLTQLGQQSSSGSRAAPRSTRDSDQQSQNRPAQNNSINRRPTIDVRSPSDVPRRQPGNTGGGNSGSGDASTADSNTGSRTRDAKGRFIGSGAADGKASESNWLERVKNSIESGVKGGLDADTRGVDPTVDALNELGTLFSPVGKMASFALKPLSGMLRSRKRNEPLSREESEHNEEQIRQLRRIADNSGSGANGAGMGKVAIGMISAVARRFPVIAAALGIAAAVDNADKNRPEEQGDINPDNTSNKGSVGVFNRMAKNTMNAVRGAANTANKALGGDDDYYDDGTTANSKNRLGLKTDAVNGGKIKGFDDKKAKRIAEVASNIGVEPNDLAAIISFETAGTFSPSSKNSKTSATGLIQFMKGSGGTKGKYYGMDRKQFAGLSFDEQMGYVEKYYKDRGFDGKTKHSLADAYTAVTGYGYKKGSKAYELNKVWDTDKNGYISKGEAVKNPKFKEHQRQYFTKNPLPVDQSVKEQPVQVQPVRDQYNRLNTNPTQPTKQANIIQLPPTNTRSAPQLTPLKPVPQVKDRLTSEAPQIVQLASSDDNIGQNVQDRDIAHGVTGGLGARNWNG